MTGVRLASNVEILRRVLRELLEKERQQGVDIFASGDGVTDGGTTVGVANVDGLVEEDDRSICVP